MAEVFKNYIDGRWLPPRTEKLLENRNPANHNDLIGLFPASDQNDVDKAVAAAKKALRQLASCARAQTGRTAVSGSAISCASIKKRLPGS